MTPPLRIGIWALVHGNRAALQDPLEPYDASWRRNRALVLEAEALGYDCVLVAQHTMNPHKVELGQLEAWTATAALAAEMRRIELIAAIKPVTTPWRRRRWRCRSRRSAAAASPSTW